MRFEGKVIIVTGASSGIGRATAKQFAMEGGKVVAAARRFERLEALRDEVAAAGAPGCILPVKTDVRDPAQIDAMFDTCLAEFGHLDVLVNNAGMLDGQLPIHETSPEIYDMIYETNQRAVYLGCQRAIKIFLEQGTPANIVNVASAASLRGLKGGTMYVSTNRERKNFLPSRLVRPTSHASGKAISVPNTMVTVAAMRVFFSAPRFIW